MKIVDVFSKARVFGLNQIRSSDIQAVDINQEKAN